MRVLFYRIIHVIIFILAKVVFRLRIVGYSNIPKEGGVIIAANHVSYLDPPLIACSILRRVNFMAMAELFKNPFCGAFYRLFGAFPVRREKADASAIRHAIRLIKDGKLLLMFPEGTRSYDGTLQETKRGIGMVVALGKAKVVPTFIKGTEKALPRGSWRLRPLPVTVYFGEPLEFSDLPQGVIPTPTLCRGRNLEGIALPRIKYWAHNDRKRLYNNINIKIMEEIAEMQERVINQESK